jgi:diaminopimelate epimerase
MLTKHHGLGNDFLIAVNPAVSIGPDDAIRWCDRRRGVGADGLISASQHGDDLSSWSMTLWNADGSRAEISGNGLRCLGQALVLIRDDGQETRTFEIHTDAGLRMVEVQPNRASNTDLVRVDMGTAKPGPPPWTRWSELGLVARHQMGVDMGNPHLVVVVDQPERLDLARIGPIIDSDYPDGVNIEFIEIKSRWQITLRVWERGVGLTEACGSGACAGAWASHSWNLVDKLVTVEMPGGSVSVELIDGDVVLTGPATFIAVVEIEQR